MDTASRHAEICRITTRPTDELTGQLIVVSSSAPTQLPACRSLAAAADMATELRLMAAGLF